MNSFSKTQEQKVSNQKINIIINEYNNKILELQNKIKRQEKFNSSTISILAKQSRLLESLGKQIR